MHTTHFFKFIFYCSLIQVRAIKSEESSCIFYKIQENATLTELIQKKKFFTVTTLFRHDR